MSASTIAMCLAVFCGLVSVGLPQYVEKRRFYRRNAYGTEIFPSYRAALRASIWEKGLLVASVLTRAACIGLLLVFAIIRCAGADDAPKLQHAPRLHSAHLRAHRD